MSLTWHCTLHEFRHYSLSPMPLASCLMQSWKHWVAWRRGYIDLAHSHFFPVFLVYSVHVARLIVIFSMQVVQKMFDLMDSQREAYERIEGERNELDERWKMERENLRKTQKVLYSRIPLFHTYTFVAILMKGGFLISWVVVYTSLCS